LSSLGYGGVFFACMYVCGEKKKKKDGKQDGAPKKYENNNNESIIYK
jgi:hypothetical protein